MTKNVNNDGKAVTHLDAPFLAMSSKPGLVSIAFIHAVESRFVCPT